MRVAISLCLLAVPLVLAGCGQAEPKFVYNERTGELQADLAAAVRDQVDAHFGTPTRSVAWLKLPADFGTVRGTVQEVISEDGQQAHRFKVELSVVEEGEEAKQGESQPEPVSPEKVANMGLLWLAGRYAGRAGVTVPSEQGEPSQYIGFQVRSYDPESGILTLKQALSPPPAPGDTFEVIGHRLSYGRTLYAQHCQHCHGVSGDGNGPTARYLNPRPRDYRRGIYKFKSTPLAERPTRDDLKRVITQGIPGTYMPSFLLLKPVELEALIEYVRWLSMRGEYELALTNSLYAQFEKKTFAERVQSRLESARRRGQETTAQQIAIELLEREISRLPETSDREADFISQYWSSVEDGSKIVRPSLARVPNTPESRARGRVHYIKNCAACHGATGRGNGPQTEDYMVDETTGQKAEEPGLFDAWGNRIDPRDLTRGIYRGGRRPLDLYRRVAEGINGTPMPPFKQKLNDEQIWDVVNYVMHLPFQEQQPASAAPAAEQQTAAVP